MEQQILLALYCAIVGYTYTNILTEPGEILGWWKRLLNKIFLQRSNYSGDRSHVKSEDFNKPFKVQRFVTIAGKQYSFRYKLRNYGWLYKIFTCHRCFTGELALWHYIFTTPVLQWDLATCILKVSAAILFADIFKEGIAWMKKR